MSTVNTASGWRAGWRAGWKAGCWQFQKDAWNSQFCIRFALFPHASKSKTVRGTQMSECFKVSSSGPFANTIVLGLGQNIIDILRAPLASSLG